jgi:hypothetical protein
MTRPRHAACIYCGKGGTKQQLPQGRAHILCIPLEQRQATVTSKVCGGCGRDLPREQYHTNAKTRDGFQDRCKECSVGRPKKPRSRTKLSWNAMKDRCGWPGHPKYADYGGAGIKVCDRWLGKNGYKNFVADMGERPRGKTLDRYPDPAGNYEPDNCRWATPSEQSRNRRNVAKLTAFGKTQTLSDWTDEYRISHSIVRQRLDRGWGLEDALTLDTVRAPKGSGRAFLRVSRASQSIET